MIFINFLLIQLIYYCFEFFIQSPPFFQIIISLNPEILIMSTINQLIIYNTMSKKVPQILNKEEEDMSSQLNVNPFESNSEHESQQRKTDTKKTKKLKKNKKDKDRGRKTDKPKKAKKSKKSKKSSKAKEPKQEQYQYEEEEEESERNSMFDDEAESGEEDQEGDQEAEIGFEEERARYQQLYKRPNATERLLERFQGKNERQINAQYSKKAYAMRHEQDQHPSERDPKIYIVTVRPKSEQDLAIRILNKARYFTEKNKNVPIVSVIALKRRYPGKIFVEAFSQRQVKQFLDGFTDAFLGKKIQQLPNEQYMSLFIKPVQQKIDFKENTFVRIQKGLYEGDLAKIFKVKKATIDVIIVPRINIQDIRRKILKATEEITDEAASQAKKEQLFKLLTDHKQKNYKERPSRKQLFEEDFAQLKDMPGIKNIRLSSINGLIILNFSPSQLGKVHGTYLPVQMIPFTSEGKFIEEMKQDIGNFVTSIDFKKGEDVEIVVGAMEKHYGTLIEIKANNIGVIQCKNKQMKGVLLEQPLQNLSKRFKQGQRVKVTSGLDNGKTGIILKLQPRFVQIWTDNSNSIRVSKRNLQVSLNSTITAQNVHGLKKDDLIKTNHNHIGVVVQTTKDNIKILNTNNVVEIVSNLDFDQKINMNNLVAKNKVGDEIKSGSIVTIKAGINEGKRCRVIHVYRQQAFLFNQAFVRNGGVTVQSVQNCGLLAKSGRVKPIQSTNLNSTLNQDYNTDKDIKVGQTIKLKTGALKGYTGIVKTITSDRIEVRVLSKALTQWVPIKQLISKPVVAQEGTGATPNRLYSSFRGFNNQHLNSPVSYD